MARITLGANMRSNTPPIPPAPSQLVEIRTSDAAPRGQTVNVVTLLEFVSDLTFIKVAGFSGGTAL